MTSGCVGGGASPTGPATTAARHPAKPARSPQPVTPGPRIRHTHPQNPSYPRLPRASRRDQHHCYTLSPVIPTPIPPHTVIPSFSHNRTKDPPMSDTAHRAPTPHPGHSPPHPGLPATAAPCRQDQQRQQRDAQQNQRDHPNLQAPPRPSSPPVPVLGNPLERNQPGTSAAPLYIIQHETAPSSRSAQA